MAKTKKQALAWAKGGWKKDKYAKRPFGQLGIDVDGFYGLQCKDFSNGYSIFLGLPFTWGDAIVLWTKTQKGWDKKTDRKPRTGDVFVKDYVSGGVNYGHTGVVIEVGTTGFYSIDQNWFNSSLTKGSPPARVFHPYGTVKGFLRPKYAIVEDMYKGKSAEYWHKKYKNARTVGHSALQVLYKFYLGKGISDYGKKSRLGKQTFQQAQAGLMKSGAMKNRVESASKGELDLINHVPKKIKDAYVAPKPADFEPVNEQLYKKKEG